MLSVRENGTGMSADVLQRATEPFFTTKPSGGHAPRPLYGPWLCGAVRRTVTIESKVGKGTSVTLYLPRFRGEVAQEPTDRTAPSSAAIDQKKTVLLRRIQMRCARSTTIWRMRTRGRSTDCATFLSPSRSSATLRCTMSGTPRRVWAREVDMKRISPARRSCTGRKGTSGGRARV